MRRLAWAALACLLFAGIVPAATQAAANDIVIDVNVTVPVFGSAVNGTFTISPTAGSGATRQGPWSFTGTVAGQPASARGEGRGTIQDAQTVVFELTTIDEWQMGLLPRPVAPASITLRSTGSTVALTWERLGLTGQFAISPALSPSAGLNGGHYRLASASSSSQPGVTSLPQTGAGSARATTGTFPLTLFSLAALCALLGLWFHGSRRSPAQTSPRDGAAVLAPRPDRD